MVCRGEDGMLYGMQRVVVWYGMVCCMVCREDGMLYGMLCGMQRMVCCMVCRGWYVVWYAEDGMLYGMLCGMQM